VRSLKTGRTIGGIPFTRGPLAHFLRNRFYIGEVVFKGEVFPGEQPAILDRGLFDAVQAKLNGQRNNRASARVKSNSLLIGRLYDDRGNRMSPSHCSKQGIRYRYYVSSCCLAEDAVKATARNHPAAIHNTFSGVRVVRVDQVSLQKRRSAYARFVNELRGQRMRSRPLPSSVRANSYPKIGSVRLCGRRCKHRCGVQEGLTRPGAFWMVQWRRRSAMVRVTVLYPNESAKRFDHDYYASKHLPRIWVSKVSAKCVATIKVGEVFIAADKVQIAHAIEIGVICHTGRAIAAAELGAEIELHLRAAGARP
jgi:Recombinase